MRARGWLWQGLAAMTCALAIACSGSGGGGGGAGDGGDNTSTGETGDDGGAPGKVGDVAPGTPAAGQKFVQQRDCAHCHTPDLAGSITALPGYPDGVQLYSPNLTPDPDTGIGKWTDAQLVEAIRDGIDNNGEILCPQMKHYKTMTDDEVGSIIAYLKSLPPIKRDIPGSICPPLKNKP